MSDYKFHFHLIDFDFCPSTQTTSDSASYVLNKLLDASRYDKRYPPPGEKPFKVEIGLLIYNIVKLSTLEQQLTVQLRYGQTFNDSRLSFSNETGLESIPLRGPPLIWVPGGTFRNILDLKTHEQVMWIYPSGKVEMSDYLTVTVPCPMNLWNYPFDVQKCPIKIVNGKSCPAYSNGYSKVSIN